MTFTYRTIAAATVLAASLVFAASSQPAFSARGKQIYSEDFNGTALSNQWARAKGSWEVADGAVKVSQIPADNHAAVARHAMMFRDAIFEFAFRFDGAKAIHLSLNNSGGHVCRLIISPAGMLLQADAHGDLKAEKMGTVQATIAPGEWHKVVVEVRGKKMTAQIDGKDSVSGQSDRIEVEKANFGFPVSGVSASIDYVRVYEIAR